MNRLEIRTDQLQPFQHELITLGTKAYIEGALQYWEERKALTIFHELSDYQKGIETGLKAVLNHIQKLEQERV